MAREMLGYFVKVRVRGKSVAYSLREQCANASGADFATIVHDAPSSFVVKAQFRGEIPDFLKRDPWVKHMSQESVIFKGSM